MYRVLQDKRKSLIVVDEVVAKSALDKVAPVKQIESAIQIAEARLKGELCLNFYNDFRDKKNKIVTLINQEYIQSLFPISVTINVGDVVNAIEFIDDDWYVDFWYEYLWKLLAEMVVYVASPTNFSRFEVQGEMQNNPRSITNEGQGAASSDLKTMDWKMDRLLMDRIAPLITAMNEYLYTNWNSFKKVDCKDWSTRQSGVRGKTAWITGIYKDNQIDSKCYKCSDKY